MKILIEMMVWTGARLLGGSFALVSLLSNGGYRAYSRDY